MTLGMRSMVHSSMLRQLEAVGARVQRGFSRLASGSRIASAADDPAGLGVSERMRALLVSRRMAARNVADGLGLARTSEAALAAVAELLIRLRELAVSAANGTNTQAERAIYQVEWDELVAEISRLGRGTTFAGLALLGSNRSVKLQVGAQAGDVLAIMLTDLEPLTQRLSLGGPSSSAPARSISLASNALEWVSSRRARLGAGLRRLEGASRTLEDAGVHLAAAESRVRDADLAVELAELTGARMIQDSAAALLAQANREGALVLELLASVPPPAPDTRSEGQSGEPLGGPGHDPTGKLPPWQPGPGDPKKRPSPPAGALFQTERTAFEQWTRIPGR